MTSCDFDEGMGFDRCHLRTREYIQNDVVLPAIKRLELSGLRFHLARGVADAVVAQ